MSYTNCDGKWSFVSDLISKEYSTDEIDEILATEELDNSMSHYSLAHGG